MELLLKYWAPIWATLTTLGLLTLALMHKTYAKREEVEALTAQVSMLQGRLDELPTRVELHQLHLEISELRGDIKAIQPQLQGARHLADLLLQNELKEQK